MRKKLIIVLVLALSALQFSFADNLRQNITINSGWNFGKDAVKVNLPHSWNTEDAFDQTPGYFRGKHDYSYIFIAPSSWTGKSVIVKFEGANQVAEVSVNGTEVGKHIGGYTAFSFDIGRLLKFGEENELKVTVDNSHNDNIPPLNADFTFYGGIYRNVRLIVADRLHFNLCDNAGDGVYVLQKAVSEKQAVTEIRGVIVNDSDFTGKAVVQCRILDREGHEVAYGQAIVRKIRPGRNEFAINDIIVPEPELWSPENPTLYTASVTLSRNGKEVCDEIDIPVGFRWYEFSGDGFFLNGNKYPLKGTNRHQDFKGYANALPEALTENDIRIIKSTGFNFLRLAHYPQSPDVYRLCDELGLLVWSEVPVVNDITMTKEFADNSLNMLKEQIRQTRNHPCIIMYGYMNEIFIRNSPAKVEAKVALARRLDSLAKAEAPERSTVMAVHYDETYNRSGITMIPDVIGYNLYFGWYYENLEYLTKFLNEEHAAYPDRPIIVSEMGADADITNHSANPRSWDYSEEYQCLYHYSYQKQFASLPFIAGYSLWNTFDFGAEGRHDATPFINQKGLYTYDRQPKDAAWFYKACLLSSPVLYIAGHNYSKRSMIEDEMGCGSAAARIEVYSNGSEVTLIHNGKNLGEKKVVYNMAVFDIALTDGANMIEAVGDNGASDDISIDCNIVPLSLKNWKGDEVAVNVGSDFTFVDHNTGTVWIPDVEYNGYWGRIGGVRNEKAGRQMKVGISNNIFNTDCNPLYQTFTEGVEGYRFDVPDGTYRVTLCFVENNTKKPVEEVIYNLSDGKEAAVNKGGRVFSASVGGNVIFEDMNLFKTYGPLHAVDFTSDVKVTDGSLEIEFTPVIGKTTLSGIKIKRL